MLLGHPDAAEEQPEDTLLGKSTWVQARHYSNIEIHLHLCVLCVPLLLKKFLGSPILPRRNAKSAKKKGSRRPFSSRLDFFGRIIYSRIILWIWIQ